MNPISRRGMALGPRFPGAVRLVRERVAGDVDVAVVHAADADLQRMNARGTRRPGGQPMAARTARPCGRSPRPPTRRPAPASACVRRPRTTPAPQAPERTFSASSHGAPQSARTLMSLPRTHACATTPHPGFAVAPLDCPSRMNLSKTGVDRGDRRLAGRRHWARARHSAGS